MLKYVESAMRETLYQRPSAADVKVKDFDSRNGKQQRSRPVFRFYNNFTILIDYFSKSIFWRKMVVAYYKCRNFYAIHF